MFFMKIRFTHNFESIAGIENLLCAWEEFVKGKRNKQDVQEFSLHLMDNIFLLQTELLEHAYKHGSYQAFNICDPKPRNIHKAPVRDRLLHHAIYRQLYPFFDRTFIADSYSCRNRKGVYKAVQKFRTFSYIESKNNTRTCWVLKCDVKKFFASIDHEVLLAILKERIVDEEIMWLLYEVVKSFSCKRDGVGLPLGNLASQLFANVYMNELDQFIKHILKAKHYIRYADDFVIFSQNKKFLEDSIVPTQTFLHDTLRLTLHEDKIHTQTLSSGVDFLGWVHFPECRILRTTTKKRMLKRIQDHPKEETLHSYLGLLRHGNTHKLQIQVLQEFSCLKIKLMSR